MCVCFVCPMFVCVYTCVQVCWHLQMPGHILFVSVCIGISCLFSLYLCGLVGCCRCVNGLYWCGKCVCMLDILNACMKLYTVSFLFFCGFITDAFSPNYMDPNDSVLDASWRLDVFLFFFHWCEYPFVVMNAHIMCTVLLHNCVLTVIIIPQ